MRIFGVGLKTLLLERVRFRRIGQSDRISVHLHCKVHSTTVHLLRWQETGDTEDAMWSCSQSIGLISNRPSFAKFRLRRCFTFGFMPEQHECTSLAVPRRHSNMPRFTEARAPYMFPDGLQGRPPQKKVTAPTCTDICSPGTKGAGPFLPSSARNFPLGEVNTFQHCQRQNSTPDMKQDPAPRAHHCSEILSHA